MSSTFAFQLGETLGARDGNEALREGQYAAAGVSLAARYLADAIYRGADELGRGEFASGYRAGWEQQADTPPFLYHAPLHTPVIVNEATLQSALEAALPDVEVIGFHHALARNVLSQICRLHIRSRPRCP